MDADERSLFEDSLSRACAAARGADLDQALEELGWSEALSSYPRLAVSSLFERVGAANTTTSALSTVLSGALGVADAAAVGMVLPALGRWQPPGRIVGTRLAVAGVAQAGVGGGATAWVVATSDDGLFSVAVDTADLTLRPVHGVDPRLGLLQATAEDLPLTSMHLVEVDRWDHAVAQVQLALSHELVGASRAMLELARIHALDRVQFGQPIATFQAVRHRLADALVAVEATDAALSSAWDEGTPAAAATAKALAGRGAKTVSRHCQQVLAGIGFTTEHDFHHYARRVLVLDQLFGTARALTRELGRRLVSSRQLPPMPPL